jgi:hypothetical protein
MAATNDSEPRALGAALAAPAFVTRSHGAAMHAANRHVERWAPETTASRVRSLHSLGFVDRLVAPWMETAQRSASLRLFSGYARTGGGEHEPRPVSWVFPRPWYQDELDWMAAARQVQAQAPALGSAAMPSLLTTRGTYVPPASATAAPRIQMPAALYEYVAPQLSLARPGAVPGTAPASLSGEPARRSEPYSPLISLAAVQAAELMSRAVAPLTALPSAAAGAERRAAAAPMTPGLRSVLASILERAAAARGDAPASRLSQFAPELVTPPAPRPGEAAGAMARAAAASDSDASASATQLADQYAQQHARIAELSRIAQRDAAVRAEAMRARTTEPAAPDTRDLRATAERAEATRARGTEPAAPDTRDLRATAERAEREIRQRAEAQRQADAIAAAERARIADRSGAQRLHDRARTDAAAHARAIATSAPAAAPGTPVGAAEPARPAASSPEIAAAIAGLPPELSALVGSMVQRRPDRAVQAIGELNTALRTVELLARSSAAGIAFEATRGPRLMMPAGLGGLVSALDRAPAIADRPGMLGLRPLALPSLQSAELAAPTRPVRPALETRVPLLPWLSMASPAAAAAPAALGATAAASPAALSHVAWADRWLARFAGAAPHSLQAINAAGASSPAVRIQALASAAPDAVFVAPQLRGDLDADLTRRAALSVAPSGIASSAPSAPGPRLISPAETVLRFDDNAETPDDVFAAISAATTRGRAAPRRPESVATIARAPQVAPPAAAPAMASAERMGLVDLVAHAAPAAPGAGLSAQLAASPFAPALRHVLALPSATSFDVRSLFGADLGAAYLAGMIGPGFQELSIGAQAAPAWASWSERALGTGAAERNDRIDRIVPGFDAAYVAPDLAGAAGAVDGRAIGSDAIGDAVAGARVGQPVGDPAAELASLTTLRSALLGSRAVSASEQRGSTAFAGAPGAQLTQDLPAVRQMIEAMNLPMLGEVAQPSAAWAGPGMVADRAYSWSVAQERSSSDLSLDFIPPELVLAARVYGLGPAEAAQAARLAVAGSGQLGAMASAVDRTFVEAMAIGREARASEAARRAVRGEPGEPLSGAAPASAGTAVRPAPAVITTAYPVADGQIAAAIAPSASPAVASDAGLPAPSRALFGVARGTPRGAFLWPSAAVAALGMTALGSDGQLSISVAALELLAAQVVAELGTYTALSEAEAGRRGDAAGVLGAAGTAGATAARDGEPGIERDAVASGRSGQPPAAGRGEPSEPDVLAAASAYVPAARRARFEALYLALGPSGAGRSWSPAARAARALALAGRGEDSVGSARARAASAWDVLPVVYAGLGAGLGAGAGPGSLAGAVAAQVANGAPSSNAATAASIMASYLAPGAIGRAAPGGLAGARGTTSSTSAYADADDRTQVTVAPGLAGLSARAGETLGAYVTPVAPPSAPVARDHGQSGAVLRAPTAAPEYVQTRSGGRHGGGEVEIPPWFEAAALKMLQDRSGDGISLAELTLVNAAPASQIAASTRAAPSASPPAPQSAAGASQGAASQIDVDKVANDVYRQILIMMDAARARNGEPYL